MYFLKKGEIVRFDGREQIKFGQDWDAKWMQHGNYNIDKLMYLQIKHLC